MSEIRLSRDDSTADSLLALTTCGTPYYISPEQLASETYSYPADLWALDCVLLELLRDAPR